MKHSMLTVSEHSGKWHYITYRLHAVSREPAILPWIYYQQLYPFGARQWQWNQITTTVRRHKWSGLLSVPRVFWLEFLTYIWIANIEGFPVSPCQQSELMCWSIIRWFLCCSCHWIQSKNQNSGSLKRIFTIVSYWWVYRLDIICLHYISTAHLRPLEEEDEPKNEPNSIPRFRS